MLIQSKCDLLSPEEKENMASLTEFSKSNNFINCFRVSAKTGENVKESMEFLIKNIIERMEKMSDGTDNPFSTERRNVTISKEIYNKIEQNNKKGRVLKNDCC